jgi:prepilin-type N-terminal cleavage/methylation domain-containing protein/prepilin-type processing-associated H-X9-DG protein
MKLSVPQSRAFTLVELLVVIAIVSVLAVLGMGAYRNTQENARGASCASNLRGMGSAFLLYAADNGGLLPAPRYREDRGGDNNTKKNWQFEIASYLSVSDTSFKTMSKNSAGAGRQAFCPTYVLEYKNDSKAQALVSGGYGMNVKYSSQASYDTRAPLAAVVNPARTIIAGDSDDYHIDIKADSWGDNPKSDTRFGSGDPVRHNRTANYAFLDGHVESLTPADARALLTAAATQ